MRRYRVGVFLSAFLGFAALIIGLYARPFVTRLDVGPSTVRVTGIHGTERNDDISFSYSKGTASAWFPRIGHGTFAATIRMGGPGGEVPVTTKFNTSSQSLAVGAVAPIRTYHMLLPSDRSGNGTFHIHSTTTQLGDDPRPLGVLIDWLELRSLGGTRSPLLAFGVMGVLMLLLWTTHHFFAASFSAVLRLFVLWRVALWLAGLVGLWFSRAFYPVGKALSYHGEIVERDNLLWKTLTESWSQWDSVHYQAIALSGYTFTGVRYPTIAFFPLYPLLIQGTLPLTRGNIVVAALIISHVALLCALTLLFEVLRRDFSWSVAYHTLGFLLIFPTSLFFGAAYSESLALALIALSLWAMRAERWWLAGIAGALLTLTRLPGIMITVVILVAYVQKRGWNWRAIRPSVLAVVLPPMALAGFMAFQQWRFGTPAAFMLAQQRWNQQLSFPWTMPYVLVQSILTSYEWPVIIFQALIWIIFLGLIVFTVLRLPMVYSLTLVLLLLPAYLSNFPGSLPRYALMGVPAFVALAMMAKQPWSKRLVVGMAVPFLVLAIVLFVNGFWVA